MTILFEGDVANDYHQIYLCDARLPPMPDDYSEAALARRVVAGPQAIVIHVEREMPVPVRIELHTRRPQVDLAGLDHAVETALSAPSGELVLTGLLAYAPAAPRFAVPPGRLGAIVTFAALASLSLDGLDGDDRYAVHLWPEPDEHGADREVEVLKRFG